MHHCLSVGSYQYLFKVMCHLEHNKIFTFYTVQKSLKITDLGHWHWHCFQVANSPFLCGKKAYLF